MLILLVAGLVGMGVAVAIWFPLSVMGTSEPPRRAMAKVVQTGACPTGMDVVEVDGSNKAKLDACGHREGEQVEVIWKAGSPDLVQTASSAPTGKPLANRLASLLLWLSASAGGVYAYLFRYGPIKLPKLLADPKPS
ncbi:hypothetical protein Lesp02_80800 [Lentzea sp. NBRC 105346]|uniref:hypothetical protein n=1 Tax=Lentzea sp. NBRC 105346 TaxID=3032205 RepID=UPI0024A093F3|nr:hypothetical protein [Lentzea sp. NBRC 105346]GLZ35893.1 hypothetical protein Lesp02_80800 [Lentzea sp. NBRC 105346]